MKFMANTTAIKISIKVGVKMSQEKILVVDDEREIAELIRDYLKAEGFTAIIAFDGQQGLQYFDQYQPDLAILDIMLPKLDGMELCRMIRAQSAIPIIMLSAKKSDIDKILGLGLGADDYVTKPFSPGELAARVKAHLRRYTNLTPSTVKKTDVLTYGELQIHLQRYVATINGKDVSLSAKEFELLCLLARNPSQVFTRDQIFDRVWGFNQYGDINTVTVHIKRIREKIEPDQSQPKFIKTVWGVGYKFEGGNP